MSTKDKPTEYAHCHCCGGRRKEDDMYLCDRVKCFNFLCEDCHSGYKMELQVCGEECAEDAARELTAKVRALHAAAAAQPEYRVIEYVDNSWLRTPSVGQELEARMRSGKRVA